MNTKTKKFKACGYTWNAHKPGEPCPVPVGALVIALLRGENETPYMPSCNRIREAFSYTWTKFPATPQFEIIGWRYADEQPKQETKADFGESWEYDFDALVIRDSVTHNLIARFENKSAILVVKAAMLINNTHDNAKKIAGPMAELLSQKTKGLMPSKPYQDCSVSMLRDTTVRLFQLLDKVNIENEQMREAINEAHETLKKPLWGMPSANEDQAAIETAITKLAPFVKEEEGK